MNISKVCISFLILLAAKTSYATFPLKVSYKEGVHYKTLNNLGKTKELSEITKDDGKKVHIFAFFNYACPACKYVYGFIQDWQTRNGENIVLHNMPVAFNRPLKELAKMYFAAHSMNESENLDKKFFQAFQVERINLLDEKILTSFLNDNNINAEKFNSVKNSLSTLQQVEKSDNLSIELKIIGTPSFIVHGKNGIFCTDLQMAQGSANNLLAILNYLISLENAS